jgi:hypothetical protein
MKLFTGWVMSAGLVLTAAAANAQTLAPYEIGEAPYAVASDIDGPYAEMPPEALAPRYRPILLPPSEIYAIIRDSGFSPLEIPQQRGLVYTIAVIDRGSGDDGRLVVDARSGRIVRFMPAYRMGDNLNEDLRMRYGPVGPLPPVTAVRGPPRPPLSIPRLASRTPYVPKPGAPRRSIPPRNSNPRRRSNPRRCRRNRRRQPRNPQHPLSRPSPPRRRSGRRRKCPRCRTWSDALHLLESSPQNAGMTAIPALVCFVCRDDGYFLRPAAARIRSAICWG